MKAMLIGFPKSGTTTVHRACKRSGLRSAHWRTPDGYCGKLIYENFLSGKDPLAQLAEFDVITQADVCIPGKAVCWPNLDFSVLQAIRRHHPDCVFVLNRRDPQKVVSSITRWRSFRHRITIANVIGLPNGFGAEDSHLLNWIEGHYAAAATFFATDPHYLDLPIDAADARERLSAALGVKLRWWGVANENR
jgi:hypothetical protein